MHVLANTHTYQPPAALRSILLLMSVMVLAACGTTRESELDLLRGDQRIDERNEQPTTIIKGVVPFDSLTNPGNIDVQVWRLEADQYPDSIHAYVRAFDSLGRFVSHLAAPYRSDSDAKQMWNRVADYSRRDDQVVAEYSVREFGEKDSIGYAISMVLDHGGSMGGTIRVLQAATEKFIRMKSGHDNIGVVKFGSEPRVDVRLRKRMSDILTNLEREEDVTEYGLYTALYDGAMVGINMLREADEDSPRVMVLFTDGEDNASEATAEDVYAAAKEAGVRIYCVGFGYTNDDVLGQLSEYTGGRFYKAYSPRELEHVFTDIYFGLRHFYKVSYRPPSFEGLHIAEFTLTTPGGVPSLDSGSYDVGFAPLDTATFQRSIEFEYASAIIKPTSNLLLDEIADALARHPRVRLAVWGHTDNYYQGGPISVDNTAGVQFNQKLSEDRAQAVVNALTARNIDPARLQARGFGMMQPVATNKTEQGRAKNRRTEFKIIRK